ncbi:DUF3785 family protein [Clostridium sp. UBA4548]|uniref:DUF3785 family protein n=1 Tax=Clostridium sp. UBA4548 TaxID=1946361 RepID=UPI0025C1F76E|nr:DUF3785 family protein [Clostridium sp. UBA4548]
MNNYKFQYEDKEFELKEENCDYINNEEVENFNISAVLELLNKGEEVGFTAEYYDSCCEECKFNRKDDTKFFEFLEYHFYMFTKDNNYVLSTISPEYKDVTLTSLVKDKKIDNSYIVSILVCKNCGTWAIEVEQCDM